ncbi:MULTISPECIES: xanthine dehydrogenase family protein subunit M [unclassified Sporosarcina]|uniref:FAD binding domain-containing protein n=1 Tax=unclassified Sporosarcina TaxID=2647733 RepID=UPI000C16B957|nr:MULTISPECIES: xanthine dehydrogenase family protein subunit M [unclassified Sporosarcina]PID15001.1 molybdopterin dehydrogenase [Sporosarcina sp. P34]PID25231.1 molybdopterin dehydrogenase [Sporosarcina sp. P7]
MKPAVFNYIRPESVEETLQLLSDYGDDAKILSGGQSLIPVLNMRLSTPKYLIDIGRLEGLNYIREEGDHLSVGALVKHKDIESSPLVKELCPILGEAIRWVGTTQIRNRGTIGGSIAHGDPSAELPCVLAALRGEIVVASLEGEDVLSPEEFFLTYMLTSMQPDQVIKEIRFPIMSKKSAFSFVEVARTHGDFALAEAAVILETDETETVIKAQIAVGGVNPTPTVLEEVEDHIMGKKLTDELLTEVRRMTEGNVDPESDLHGTAEYRRELVGVLVQRALKTAGERVKKGAGRHE